jgi:hypothetical protein
VRPLARKPGQQIFQLRQLDLQLSFIAARALREDIEDGMTWLRSTTRSFNAASKLRC